MSVVLMDGKKVAEEFLQTQHFTDNTLRPPFTMYYNSRRR